MGRNNDHGIARFNRIFASRVIIQPLRLIQATNRLFFSCSLSNGIPRRGSFFYAEFQRLCLVSYDLIKSFYIASHRILHCSYILKDQVCSKHFRLDQASKIQGIDHTFKSNPVYLRDQLCIGFAGCIQESMIFSSSKPVKEAKASV